MTLRRRIAILFCSATLVVGAAPAFAQNRDIQIDSLHWIDCTFDDGFSPSVGMTGVSQTEAAVQQIPKFMSDNDQLILDSFNHLSDSEHDVAQIPGISQERYDAFVSYVSNILANDLETYDNYVKSVTTFASKFSKEKDPARQELIAREMCRTAIFADQVVVQNWQYVTGHFLVDIVNGTSSKGPTASMIKTSEDNIKAAQDEVAKSEAFIPSQGAGMSGEPIDTPATRGGQILSGSALSLTLPLGSISLSDVIARVIKQLLSVVGALALAFFVWGGLRWMLARGASDEIEKAKKIIVAAVSGLVAIFASYAVLNLILNALSK